MAETKIKNTIKRTPKAATLRVHLQDYMATQDLGVDATIGTVLDRLGETIIKLEEAKVRSN